MKNKKNILEICNWLWIGWTEKTMQIFCKYLDKDKYNIFACGIFRWGNREKIIRWYVKDLLISNWNIEDIKNFILKNNINIVHWHSITLTKWLEFDKSLELLKFLKNKKIKIIETAPFSLYNKEIDNLLDYKLFVSKTSLLKFFWKFWKYNIKKEKYSFLYNPIDTEILENYKLNSLEKNKLREQYWIWKNDFVIWKIWRANLWKWDDTIINIIPELVKNIKNIKVVIRAIPDIKKKKIDKLWLSKYFIFLSESVLEKEVAYTYQSMNCMIHTSRIWESFWMTLVEGMFFWLPVITKSTDFIKKTIFDRDNSQVEIINDKKNWFIENDNKKIIEKIVELYKKKDLYNNISEYNKKYSIDKFNWIKLTKQLELVMDCNILNKSDYCLQYYKKITKNESVKNIFIENIKALYEKFILKA